MIQMVPNSMSNALTEGSLSNVKPNTGGLVNAVSGEKVNSI